MLKKTITYEDFNGETVSEDCFFHMSQAELVELEMSQDGGMKSWLEKVVASENGREIIAQFKNILLSSYGQRSPDGRRFIKNQQLRDEFESSEAYSTLFMELVTNTDSAIAFVNGIMPKGLADEATKVVAMQPPTLVPPVASDESQTKPEPQVVTRKDITEMDGEQLKALGARVASGEIIIQEDI